QIRNSDDTVDVDEDKDPRVQYDGPLVVLTSRFSASASEILAGALQDYGRAVVVGESTTHGKGTVQSVMQLGRLLRTTNNLGAVKLTIRKFYRASGDSTQLKGVIPDIVLPSVNNVAEIGEAELDNALPFDTIKPATYEKLDRVSPVLSSLRDSSSDRVKTNKDFDWVRSDMERYKKQLEDKSVSMNEANRRKEKEENKSRLDARKKELQARGEPQRKVWEFKIRDVDLAELPLLQKTNKVAVVHAPEGQKLSDPDGKADGEEDKTEEASIPDIDYVMDEAKQILLDFVRLSKTAERPGEATAAK
ncbi:MAG: hypothetical protein FJ405_18675, partial [Verrucomicrobia bacterium]|nr:hypothetical protein [Verrucomicrobiota bacterium]